MRPLLLVLTVAALLSTACAAATYPPNTRALRDAELIARIKTALLNAPGVEATKIDVRATDGAVTLSGEVPSEGHERRAVELVRQVQGVTDVESRISVADAPPTISRVRRRPTVRS